MTQQTLPYQPHSQTSRDAAEAMPRSTAKTDRERIFQFLKRMGSMGATDEEMQRVLDINPNTQRPRRREIEKGGRIRNSGLRRKAKSGRWATVWKIV